MTGSRFIPTDFKNVWYATTPNLGQGALQMAQATMRALAVDMS